jgi:hypothetical protein
VNRKSRTRRHDRRVAHARTTASQIVEPAGRAQPAPPLWTLAAWPRWLVRLVVGVAVVIAGAVATQAMLPQYNPRWSAAAGATYALVGVVSWHGVRVLRPRLGAATAVVAVSLAWCALVATASWVSPQCPGTLEARRCTGEEVAALGMVGLLLPVALGLLALWPLTIMKVVRWGVGKAQHWWKSNTLRRTGAKGATTDNASGKPAANAADRANKPGRPNTRPTTRAKTGTKGKPERR